MNKLSAGDGPPPQRGAPAAGPPVAVAPFPPSSVLPMLAALTSANVPAAAEDPKYPHSHYRVFERAAEALSKHALRSLLRAAAAGEAPAITGNELGVVCTAVLRG